MICITIWCCHSQPCEGLFFSFLVSVLQGLARRRVSLGASPHHEMFGSLPSFPQVKPFSAALGLGLGVNHLSLSPLHEALSRQKYTCPKCNMQYLSLTVFERHVRKCDGTNPLVCRICRRMFSQACAVKEHMRGFHGIGEKVECQYCGKPFKYKTSLYTHFCEEKQKHQKKDREDT